MTDNNQLVKCSRCLCKKLPEFFELKETTGQRLKTCIKCRSRFVCDYENCKFKCQSNIDLQRHINQRHSDLRPFSCEDCDSTFKMNDKLQRHIKICTGKENISSGEFQVRKTLNEMKVKHIHNSSHSKLTDFCGKDLRFDFSLKKKILNQLL